MAKSQLDEYVAREVYNAYGYESPGLRSNEIKGKELQEIASILHARLVTITDQSALYGEGWIQKFLSDCESKRKELEPIWDADWKKECDGKKLFADLHQSVGIRVSLRKFKRRVITEMRKTPPSENWRAVESLLKSLIG